MIREGYTLFIYGRRCVRIHILIVSGKRWTCGWADYKDVKDGRFLM